MSKFITIVLSAIVLASTQQLASAADNVSAGAIVQSIELPVPSLRMDPAIAAEYVGVYDLSNGDTLKIVKRGMLFYASLGTDDVRHRLVTAGKSTFVSVDKQLKIHLERDGEGVASGEVFIAVGANGLPVMASLRR